MPQEKTKTLRYRRAVYVLPDDVDAESVGSLEDYLKQAHHKFKTVDSRRIDFETGYTLEVRDARGRKNVGTLLHLAAYTRNEPASIVPQVKGSDSAPVDVVPPPRNTEFMDGDIIALVAGNDVLLCGTSLHDANFTKYCIGIFNLAELPVYASTFGLQKVANADQVQLLADEGVRRLELHASVFDATIARAKRRTIRKKFGGQFMEELLSVIGADISMEGARENDSLSAELVFKFDSRKKNGKLAGKRIEALAQRVIDDEEEGFKIETGKGNVVSASTLSLHKRVSLVAYGKSVSRDAAYSELVKYYVELSSAGMLDQ